jgi:CheY-like chemotaxis protein
MNPAAREAGFRYPVALGAAERHGGPIHLLVIDVFMPEMGGRRLAERLAPAPPRLRTLYLSGYAADAVLRHGLLQDQAHFLQKPFSVTALTWKVREVLDAPAVRVFVKPS